ncbi:hypothetical protein BSNK01_00670 [Bacillaceae bacterium]
MLFPHVFSIFVSYLLVKAGKGLLPVPEGIGRLTPADWWATVFFQPLPVIAALASGFFAAYIVRNVVKGRVKQLLRRGGRKKQGESLFVLLLAGWFIYVNVSVFPWVYGTFLGLMLIYDFFRSLSERKRVKQLRQTFHRQNLSS